MEKYILTILIFLVSLGVWTNLQCQTANEELTQVLEQAFQKNDIPGMAAAIVNKDQILYQNQFGYTDLETKKPYTVNTIHNIGSTSKTFIGIAIMQLVEAGKLDLDADINQYLPFEVRNPYHPSTSITLRQLATHTAAIRDRTFNYDLRAYTSRDNAIGNRKGLPLLYKIQFKRMLKNEQLSLGEFLERTLSKKGKWFRKKNFYKNPPGTTENYSNIGAALAGYIVEVVTQEKYADYVAKNILKPLGMNGSGWVYQSVVEENLAKRYIGVKAVPKYDLITYPDGGLISSTADLSTYLMAMMRGYEGENNIINAESYKVMMHNQYETIPLSKTMKKAEGRSGIFWDIFGKTGNGDIGHSGSDPGILSFMYFDPVSGIGCVLTTNIDSHKMQKPVVEIWQLLTKHRENF